MKLLTHLLEGKINRHHYCHARFYSLPRSAHLVVMEYNKASYFMCHKRSIRTMSGKESNHKCMPLSWCRICLISFGVSHFFTLFSYIVLSMRGIICVEIIFYSSGLFRYLKCWLRSTLSLGMLKTARQDFLYIQVIDCAFKPFRLYSSIPC